MIRRAKDMVVEKRANVRGGKGEVTFLNIADPGDTFGKCKMCAVLTFEPGTSIGKHRHGPDAELYYVLEGEVTVTDNGKESVLYKGDRMYTGEGGEHSIENKTDKRAVVAAVIHN